MEQELCAIYDALRQLKDITKGSLVTMCSVSHSWGGKGYFLEGPVQARTSPAVAKWHARLSQRSTLSISPLSAVTRCLKPGYLHRWGPRQPDGDADPPDTIFSGRRPRPHPLEAQCHSAQMRLRGVVHACGPQWAPSL